MFLFFYPTIYAHHYVAVYQCATIFPIRSSLHFFLLNTWTTQCSCTQQVIMTFASKTWWEITSLQIYCIQNRFRHNVTVFFYFFFSDNSLIIPVKQETLRLMPEASRWILFRWCDFHAYVNLIQSIKFFAVLKGGIPIKILSPFYNHYYCWMTHNSWRNIKYDVPVIVQNPQTNDRWAVYFIQIFIFSVSNDEICVFHSKFRLKKKPWQQRC